MKNFPELGVQIPDLLLPNSTVDAQKWAVIACDQYTSQPEYWKKTASLVGSSPSTLKLIFPEVFLGKTDEDARIEKIHRTMQQYLQSGIFTPHSGLIYVERKVDGKTRRGLMLALDLERYDFNKGSQTLIRATEGTILDRLPPRIKIRKDAPIELPHILMLIDDPEDLVIGCVERHKNTLPLAYDFDLYPPSGHLTGRFVDDTKLEDQVISGLKKLQDPSTFTAKYNLPLDTPILLFASGDGNHSLATAKLFWEENKSVLGMNHPARFALVEVENVHDKALVFEPIHRVVFDVKVEPIRAMKKFFGNKISVRATNNSTDMISIIKNAQGSEHHFGLITHEGCHILSVQEPDYNLPVGTLQEFLDEWVKTGEVRGIDYVHGDQVICDLSVKKGNAGFYLAGMHKSDLFKTVIKDGSLPRKTFSMGEAQEKRFYFEARRIIPDDKDIHA